MISMLRGASMWELLFILSCVVSGVWMIWWGYREYRRRKVIRARLAQIAGPMTLDRFDVRERLTTFLERHQIVGDGDIRDGKVYAAVPPTRLRPLALLFRNAHAQIARIPNAVNGDLYFAIKNPGEGTGWTYQCAGGVGVSDLGEAASVIERVAEDHKKSRSLYKGMTDDEVTALVRSGMSFYYKDDGSFSESNAAAQGLLDNTPEFLIARETLLLAFQIKRPEA